MKNLFITTLLMLVTFFTFAADYHVGPDQSLTTISEVPWATLNAGDRVYIHWRATPYKEKWVINRQGTDTNRIEIIGISGPQGQQPVIDGDGAVTVAGVNFWNERRGVIKIGGSNTPADGLPSYITIENLEIRSGRPTYQFTNDDGQTETYASNAASIYIEKGANIIIRNCTLHDSGNGLFIGANGGQSENILIEKNYIYNNGIVGSYYEHNTYTAAINITYQFNRFGPLRTGADGNNLKDRSAGLIVKYNWIEGGNRQLDLVDSYDVPEVANHPNYNTTHVYGNILIEPDGAGNSQIVHYGGDSGVTSGYKKGTLYFYNNTVISTRTGNTTLVRLSTNDETAEVFNNIIYTSASGNRFAMIDGNGTFNMHHNWLKTGWQDCFCTPNGIVNDLGNNITGTDPLFEDFDNQIFNLQDTSSLINMGDVIPATLLPNYDISFEYVKHQNSINKPVSGNLDIGAFENTSSLSIDNETLNTFSIYPNPVKEILTINNRGLFIKSYKIYNTIGQVVQSNLSFNTNQINISHLKSGVYFLKTLSNQKEVTVKFIKQ
ncbi:MAG: T9SS type A sorting domain-containing protein [Flavobacteriaceae bacterium]|nr:T9SS type A sorting domain-containing protein [Flavobacteriaceae bacterium]